MVRYLDPLAFGFMLWGGFQLLIAAAIGLLFGGFGGLFSLIGIADGDGELFVVGAVYGGIGVAVAAFSVLMSLPTVIAGFGLWRRASWARFLALIVGVLSLTSMPLGTLLGVGALIVLLDKDVATELA